MYPHASYKEKKMAKLDTEIITDSKLLEGNLNEDNVQLLEQNKQTRAFRNKTEKGRWNDYQVTCKMDW